MTETTLSLILLGTGNATVTECFNTCFVLKDASRPVYDRCFLVDGGGGNGLLIQMKHAGIDWREVRSVFISHRHADHIVGIFWMMRNILSGMKHGSYTGEASIYGHSESIHILRGMAGLMFTPEEIACIDSRLHLVTVEDGEEVRILGRRVVFYDIRSVKTRQFGFTMELKPNGDGVSTDPVGAKEGENPGAGSDEGARPDGNRRESRVLAFYGDEPARESTLRYMEHADWVLHEAFCLYEDADRFRPYEKNHSTVKDACETAERMGVPNLVLYHTEDSDLLNRRRRYTAEGKQYYHGNLLVPEDLDVIRLV